MAKNTGDKPVSAFELFSKSYEIVMRNIKTFAILLALPAIEAIVATTKNPIHDNSRVAHFNFFSGTEPVYAIIGIASAGIVFFIVLFIVALLVQAMLTSLEVESAQNKTPSLSHLWKLGKKYWLRLFGLALVIGMYIVGASLIGGLVLILLRNFVGVIIGVSLIIAAVLFVFTHYYLAPYAMIDKDLPVFAAMDKSATLSKKYPGSVLSVIGVSILLAMSGIVPILGPIISFILSSLYLVAPALRYEELKKLSN